MLSLEALDDESTALTIDQGDFGDSGAACVLHVQGWSESIDHLEELIARGDPSGKIADLLATSDATPELPLRALPIGQSGRMTDDEAAAAIADLVDRETDAWNRKDAEARRGNGQPLHNLPRVGLWLATIQ